MNQLRVDFATATTPAAQKAVAVQIQQRAMDQVSYIPLGQYHDVSAWNKHISHLLEGPSTVFWAVEKN
jgi:peptide/nickel transport system substrate-binding protein